MSDPMSGLGDVATGYLLKERKSTTSSSAEQTKVWETDKYLPSSVSTRAMSVVQKQVTETVSAVVETSSSQETRRFSQQDFSPEAVANRILGFVGQYVEKRQELGATDEEVSNLFDIAEQSIEKGLGIATEKLKALSWLTQGVQQDIDDTTSRLTDGLNAMRDAFLNPQEVQATSAVAQYERTDSAALTFKTQEGDEVSLNIYALSSKATGVLQTQSDSGNVIAGFESKTSAFSFEFSVRGDLNDDEQAAMADLIGSLGSTAEKFFSGDVQGAIEQAMKLGMDSEQLASFTMSLQTEQTTRTSVAQNAYGDNANNGRRSITTPLSEYRQALEETIERASMVLEDYRSAMDGVMERLAALQEKQSETKSRVSESLAFHEQLMEKLSNWMGAQQEQASNTEKSV